jgi:hypothetical protein
MAEATLNPLATLVAGVHHLFFAPLGTTLPTTVGSAPGIGLDAAFTAVGYTADTGAAFAVDTQTTNLFASQSLDPIRTIVTSKTATIQAPLIEWSAASLTAAFGGGTITAASGGWKYVPPPAGTLDEVSAVLDIVDGDERVRLVVERGIVAGSVSATLVKNAFATLPITFTALAPVDQPTAWHLLGSNDAFAAGS